MAAGSRRVKSVEDSIRDTDEPEHRLFAMSRDRLLPRWFSTVHPRYGTPYRITIATGVLVAVMAGVVPLGQLTELVNIGTLAAFLLVSIGVIVLRRTRPDLPRSFRVPLMPVLPILSALACLWLMLNLTGNRWIRFLAWMALGFAIYFAYGRRRSRCNTPGDREDAAAANAARRS